MGIKYIKMYLHGEVGSFNPNDESAFGITLGGPIRNRTKRPKENSTKHSTIDIGDQCYLY